MPKPNSRIGMDAEEFTTHMNPERFLKKSYLTSAIKIAPMH